MVAGRLQEKNGYFYMVLSYTAPDGKRKQPWVATGLPVKGNKKKAEQMLRELRKSYVPPKAETKDELHPDMLFSDYMLYWLKIIRSAVQETTWSSYCFNVKDHIVPYFEQTGVTLAGLKPRQIQSFYLHELETLKANSVLRMHANLHKALKYAVRLDLIPGNPVDKVERPKPEKYIAGYYTAEEMEELFEAAKGHKLELIIQFAAFYGLRRGEVLGLKWDAVDLEAKTLTIRHIVTSTNIDGKQILVQAGNLRPAIAGAERTAGIQRKSLRQLLQPAVQGLYLRERNGESDPAQQRHRELCQAAGGQRPAEDTFPRPSSQLRKPSAQARRSHETDSGMAGSQRHFHHRQHLRPPGCPVQTAQRRNHGAGSAPAAQSRKGTPGAGMRKDKKKTHTH